MKCLRLLFLLIFPIAGFSQECDSIHRSVDIEASFPGGASAMHKWLVENIRYPQQTDSETVGRVYASFVIEKDGTISHLRIHPTSSPEMDRHVAGAIKSMPKWTPARLNGKAVRSQYNLPIIIDWGQ